MKRPRPIKKLSSSLDSFSEDRGDADEVKKQRIWEYGILGTLALAVGVGGVLGLLYNDNKLEEAVINSLASESQSSSQIPGLDVPVREEQDSVTPTENIVQDGPEQEYHTVYGEVFTGQYRMVNANRSLEISEWLNKKYGFPTGKVWQVIDERPGLVYMVAEEGSNEAFTVKYENGEYFDDVHNMVDVYNQEFMDLYANDWPTLVDIRVGLRSGLSSSSESIQGAVERQRLNPAELFILAKPVDGSPMPDERAAVENFTRAMAADGSFATDFTVRVVYYNTYDEYKELLNGRAYLNAEGTSYQVKTNGVLQ